MVNGLRGKNVEMLRIEVLDILIKMGFDEYNLSMKQRRVMRKYKIY